MLKGVGSISIGLPLLEEMIQPAIAAGEDDVPIRAFNIFFGLGIPAPLQAEGFDDVLEPLKPLSEKLLIMRNVNQIRCDESGINAHYDGAAGAFTASAPDGVAVAKAIMVDEHGCDGRPCRRATLSSRCSAGASSASCPKV